MNRLDDHRGMGRHYDTPAGIFPSVSTVLRGTQDTARLDAWVEKVGREFAEAIRDAAANRGTGLHSEIEDTLLFGAWPREPSAWMESLRPEVEMAMGATNRLAEERVFSRKHGYAGTLDLLGDVKTRTILWDWKTYLPSNEKTREKPPKKKREFCEDYLLQTRAYAKAAGSTLHRTVDEIRVAIGRCAVRGGYLHPLPAQVIVVKREDPEYAKLWTSFEMRLGLWKVQRATRAMA